MTFPPHLLCLICCVVLPLVSSSSTVPPWKEFIARVRFPNPPAGGSGSGNLTSSAVLHFGYLNMLIYASEDTAGQPSSGKKKINTSCPKTYFWTKRSVFLSKSAFKKMINCCSTWIFPKTWKTCNYIWGDVPSLVLQVLCDFIFWFLHLTILNVNLKTFFYR